MEMNPCNIDRWSENILGTGMRPTTNSTTTSNNYDGKGKDSINNNFMKNKIKGPVYEILHHLMVRNHITKLLLYSPFHGVLT